MRANSLRLSAVSSRKGMVTIKEEFLVPQSWIWCVRLTLQPLEAKVINQPNLRIRLGNRNVSWKTKKDWTVATWNVRSLSVSGALINLAQELKRYKTMIAAIQETRWQGSKICDTGDYGIYCSCNNERKRLLTGFMIRKEVKVPMLRFETIDGHICYIRVQSIYSTSQVLLCIPQLRTSVIELNVLSMTH